MMHSARRHPRGDNGCRSSMDEDSAAVSGGSSCTPGGSGATARAAALLLDLVPWRGHSRAGDDRSARAALRHWCAWRRQVVWWVQTHSRSLRDEEDRTKERLQTGLARTLMSTLVTAPEVEGGEAYG